MAKKKKESILAKGSRSILQELAPGYVGFPSEDTMKVGDYYTRGFAVKGYPSNVSIGWLRALYDYDGDIDILEPIIPSSERSALDELTERIVKYESQRLTELEKGSVKNITSLESKIRALYEQRAKLEQNYENMFYVAITGNYYHSDEEELKKEYQRLKSRLFGKKIDIETLFLRQEECWRQTSPFGVLHIADDYYRNINTGALTDFFPFYAPEVNHGNGTFIGINIERNTPVIIDFFNRRLLSNANLFVSGISGSGKTYFVSLLTLRSVLEGVKTVLIDPEGEYKKVVLRLGGVVVYYKPGSDMTMNVFDLEEESEVDDDGNATGRIYVDIKGKAADLLNLYGVMFPSLINEAVKSELSALTVQLYHNFGFTEDPDSLCEDKSYYDENTGEFYHEKVRKIMPRMSDFRELLRERAEETGDHEIYTIYRAMAIYCEGGIYDMFDCYTTINFDYESTPAICFDVSGVEDEMLRPIAMQVVLSWAWNKFAKKDLKTKKRIVCGEAWMLLKKTMAGSDFSALFLEQCSRRIRKYNGSLCVESQNFREFVGREEGLAILSSSAVKVFMQQDAQDLSSIGSRFHMSESEKQFLLTAKRGEALMKVKNDSFVAGITSFSFEDNLITREFLNTSEEGKIV